MGTYDNASVLREVIEAWNNKDIEKAVSCAHGDARVLNVAFGTTMSFRDYETSWAKAFPDGKLEILNIVAQGDLVVAEYIGRGTNTGPLQTPSGTLGPTNKKVEVRCVEIWEFRNGKLANGRQFIDAASLMSQLGISPQQQRPSRPEVTAEARH